MTAQTRRLVRAPAHPILVALTIGTLGTSLVLDLATRVMSGGSMSLVNASYRLVGLGIIGGLALAVISALDLRKVSADSPEIDQALIRLAVDLAVVLLFFANYFWREITAFNTQVTLGQIVLSLIAVSALVAGWARQLRVAPSR